MNLPYLEMWERHLKMPLKLYQQVVMNSYFGWELHVSDAATVKMVFTSSDFDVDGPFVKNPGGLLHRFTRAMFFTHEGTVITVSNCAGVEEREDEVGAFISSS